MTLTRQQVADAAEVASNWIRARPRSAAFHERVSFELDDSGRGTALRYGPYRMPRVDAPEA